jgi:hypothetical protein
MFEIVRCLIADTKLQINKNYLETSCNLEARNSYFSQPPRNIDNIIDINIESSYLHQRQSRLTNCQKNILKIYFLISEKFQCKEFRALTFFRARLIIYINRYFEIQHLLMIFQSGKIYKEDF